MKHYLRHKNKVNEKKYYILRYLDVKQPKTTQSCFPLCQTYNPTIIFN